MVAQRDAMMAVACWAEEPAMKHLMIDARFHRFMIVSRCCRMIMCPALKSITHPMHACKQQ